MAVRRVTTCKACELSRFRRCVVPGRGELPCDLLMIGEAPGRTEDLTGRAFIGQAGKILDKLIKRSGLSRYKIYITNTVFCRPTDTARGDNREPSPEEILACMPNVMRIIRAARPRAVLMLGKVAERFYGGEFDRVFRTIHPSALLRTGGEASPYFLHSLRVYENVREYLCNTI